MDSIIIVTWLCALLVHGHLCKAQKENPLSAEKSAPMNEASSETLNLKPFSEQPQSNKDPPVQIKHSKSVLNKGKHQKPQGSHTTKQSEQKNDPLQQTNQASQQSNQAFQQSNQAFQQSNQPFQQSNQPFQQSNQQFQQYSQPFQQYNQPFQQQNQPFQQTNQPFHNLFWQNPLGLLGQPLFGNLGLRGFLGPQAPPQVTGTHSETLLHHAKDPTLLGGPVEGFNPPAPSSHQEVAEAHRNWFEAQMKSMQDKVQNLFKQ